MKNEKIKQIDTIITGFKDYLNRQYTLKPITIDRYISALNHFFFFLTENKITVMKDITTAVIKRYREYIFSEESHSNVKRARIRIVLILFDYLTQTNRILLNPTEGIENVPIKRTAQRDILTSKEITKLLKQPNQHYKEGFRDYLILKLLIATGIRMGELVSLNVFDVDLSSRKIYVMNKRTMRTRAVPLSEDVIKLLSRYLEGVRQHKSILNPDERALFLSVKRNRLNSTGVFNILKRYKRMAGITKKVTCDTLRHTLAMKLLKENMNIEDVSKLLGYKCVLRVAGETVNRGNGETENG